MVWASFLSAAKAATLPNAYGAAEGVPFQGLAAFSKTYHRHRAWQQCLARSVASQEEAPFDFIAASLSRAVTSLRMTEFGWHFATFLHLQVVRESRAVRVILLLLLLPSKRISTCHRV